MAEYVASLLLTLNDALTKPLLQVGGKTGAAMKELSKSMIEMGTTLTNKVTKPLMNFGKEALANFASQAEATEKLKNAVDNAGLSANYNITSFNKFATALQNTTNIEDDVIANTGTLLVQLAGLSQQSNEEVLPALADFSKALGMDMTTSARMASAYINGTRNMFSRYGVQLDMTGTKEERIARLTQALGDKFYGTAQTMALAGAGPIKNLQVRFEDFKESIGAIIMKAMTPLLNILSKVMSFIEGLDESTLRLVVIFGAVAAAIGPVMKGLGMLLKLLSTGISPIQGILIALAAVAAAITVVNEAWRKSANVHKDAIKNTKEEKKETNAMAKEYEQLVNIQNPNLAQKKRLIELESTLKQRLGQTSLELDKETGKWKVNTSALKQYNDLSNKIVEEETGKQLDIEKKKLSDIQLKITEYNQDLLKAQSGYTKNIFGNQIKLMESEKQKYINSATKGIKDAELKKMLIQQAILELEAQQSQASAALSGQVIGEAEDVVDEFTAVQDKIDAVGTKEDTPMYRMKFNLNSLTNKLASMAGQVAAMPELAMSDLKTKIDTVLQERSMITVNLRLETPEGMKLMTTKVERSGNNIDLNITGPLGQTLVGV